jgi:hypothetical protein
MNFVFFMTKNIKNNHASSQGELRNARKRNIEDFRAFVVSPAPSNAKLFMGCFRDKIILAPACES